MSGHAHWGVDSALPVSNKLPIKGKPTIFEHVSHVMGRQPEFWGRYLFTVPGFANGLTREEASYIFSKSVGQCRILLVFNNDVKSGPRVGGSRKDGFEDATKAINKARELGVPAGVWIYADIEPGRKCKPEWFLGWWDRMWMSEYGGGGGLYVNPIAAWAKNFAKPFREALRQASDLIFEEALAGDNPVTMHEAPTRARYLWSQQPQKGCKKPSELSFGFEPAEPTGLLGMTVLWQYQINCVKVEGLKNGLVDLDLADDRGYDSMWDVLSRV